MSLQALWKEHLSFINPDVLALAAFGVVLTAWLASRKSKGRLPPGPRGLPYIGSALSLPTRRPWEVYKQWSRDYKSDLLYLKLPGTGILVLNSAKAANDLLNRRSSIYSDRPQSIMLNDFMGMSWVFGMMQYGEEWKQHRRVFHKQFDGTPAVKMHELNSVRRLLKRLLKSSVNYSRDMQLTTGDMILSVTYGITPESEDNYFITLAESLVNALTIVAGGDFFVDLIPALRYFPEWLPGGRWKRQAEEWNQLGFKARSAPFEHVKKQMAAGTAPPSVASHFLSGDHESLSKDAQNQMQNILAEAYLGGAGATVGTLCSFTLAMCLYPEVQKNAQAALDAVLHNERLPDFSDFGNIPYLDALVNEVLRWHPGAPLGLFHMTSKDDEYDGYFIPKGTMISPNVWAILHDEAVYGEKPEEFRPERFLDADGKRNAVPDVEVAFGFGRRICPGRVMGRETLWMVAASVLTCFSLSDAVDKEGKPLDPSAIEYSNSMASRPPYFDVTIKPRNAGVEALIQNGLDA
ncbi:PAH-inducible cytochrome P450 monooxygenase PC-PAH 3 [Cyathus striatus]|nr:PAH-inducible cytochrome P450 monooxygenase PC-PAH 3 [Cyathus striatus]